MSNLYVDPELQQLVELPEHELTVPESFVDLEPPTGAPSSAARGLAQRLERDAQVEALTGLRMPSPIAVPCCEPLGPAGVPVNKAAKSTAQLRAELDRAIQQIAAAASDGDDPLGILKVAAARVATDATTVVDGTGWREKARSLDPSLLQKLVAEADENPECGEVARLLRLLAEAEA